MPVISAVKAKEMMWMDLMNRPAVPRASTTPDTRMSGISRVGRRRR
jgi:hypothetical protein